MFLLDDKERKHTRRNDTFDACICWQQLQFEIEFALNFNTDGCRKKTV